MVINICCNSISSTEGAVCEVLSALQHTIGGNEPYLKCGIFVVQQLFDSSILSIIIICESPHVAPLGYEYHT